MKIKDGIVLGIGATIGYGITVTVAKKLIKYAEEHWNYKVVRTDKQDSETTSKE